MLCTICLKEIPTGREIQKPVKGGGTEIICKECEERQRTGSLYIFLFLVAFVLIIIVGGAILKKLGFID